jgi:3'-5' exoribonuclease
LRIERLVALDEAEPALNLFETVPSAWVRDRELVQRASGLWDQMSRPFQHLFNAVMWEPGRFYRFLAGPASLNGHHNMVNGNFRHAVETVEHCLAMATGNSRVNRSVLIAAALLHDAGKAVEYRLAPARQGLVMSDRGILVGHRHTILEWLAVARHGCRVVVPEVQYLALLHALTSAKGAEWLGIREPMSLEAAILSSADRLSGQADLVRRQAPAGTGFGHYHRHLKGRPFVVGEVEVPCLA